jgi:hypothetical protein
MNITEVSNYDTNVYLISITDQVIGGVTGIANKQAIALANRTKWLKDNLTPLLGKVFFSQDYGTTLTIGSGGIVNADNSTYTLTFPLSSPDFTTANDGITRTYRVTISSFANFTYNASGNVQAALYSTTSGPTYDPIMLVNLREPFQPLFLMKVIQIGPNKRLKLAFSNNATGANATISSIQLVLDEV